MRRLLLTGLLLLLAFVVVPSATISQPAGFSGNNVTIAGQPISVTCASGCGGSTPIPTPSAGVYPVSLPTSYQTAFPTPIPTPAGGVYPISGAPTFPSTYPLPTSYATNFPTPVPIVTATPGGYPAFQPVLYGTGTTYVAPICDTVLLTPVTSAATTLLVTGSAGENIYVCDAYYVSTGTQLSETNELKWGTGVSGCGTSTVTYPPIALSGGTASGTFNSFWSNTGTNGASAASLNAPGPAAMPLVLPTAYNLCGQTGGTTIAGTFVTYYTVH